MWKTKNNQPMPQEEAYKKFIEYGYQPLRPYINNMEKIPCFDKDGYIIMIARASCCFEKILKNKLNIH